MSNASSTPTSENKGDAWRSKAFLGLRIVVVLLVVSAVVLRWDATTGFTSLIRFGDDFSSTRLPELRALPLAIATGSCYDGQFYAQIAVAADVTSPALKTALDQPAYRTQRILLPFLAHYLGFGRPWWILQVYALLNTVAWLALAWLWWQQLDAPLSRRTWVWLGCLLSLGALDSVRQSLTDLPMVLALTLAVFAFQRQRFALAALGFVAAGFVRETAVLAVQPLGLAEKWPQRSQAWIRACLCVLPIAFWCGWLVYRLPNSAHGVDGNLDWPGLAFCRHLRICIHELRAGNFDSRYTFGFLGAIGLAYQSLYLINRWREADPWARIGLSFAVLFWFLGDYVWQGYWAAARACLPMTFAFNYRLLKEHRFAPRFAVGNFFALHGLVRLLPF